MLTLLLVGFESKPAGLHAKMLNALENYILR